MRWEAHIGDAASDVCVVDADSKDGFLADLCRGDGDRAAHARMMAAAPDLLDALKAAVSQLPDRCEHEREMAAYAIAKAEGRKHV
jgi:hypothetical protein